MPTRLPTGLPTGLALLSLALLGTSCAATTAGTATPAAPAPAPTAQTLPGLLLPGSAVGAALSAGDMVVTRQVTAPWDDAARIGGGTGCLAVAGVAQRAVYAGADWTALSAQVLRDPPTSPSWSHFATQAVVLFRSASAALDFFGRSRPIWAGCADRELAYGSTPGPEAQIWSVGPVALVGDVLTVSRDQRSPQRWSCQRALTVHANVAVDVEACSLAGPTSAAAAIARRIADRLGPA